MAKLLYMVIQKPEMQVVQLGKLEVITAKQFLENPEALVDTSPVSSGASYTCYSKEEFALLATNVGVTNPNGSVAEVIAEIRAILSAKYKASPPLENEEYYEAKLTKRMKQEPEFYAQFQPVAPVVTSRVSSSRPNNSNTPKSAPATRPAGGTTKRVWDLADEVLADNPTSDAKTIRPLIIAKCEAEGINGSTAGTQFAKWKNSKSWSN